ncbi:hypothetical protein D3C75_1336360 [compost metagenome]
MDVVLYLKDVDLQIAPSALSNCAKAPIYPTGTLVYPDVYISVVPHAVPELV